MIPSPSIEPAAPTMHRRFRAPPIEGRGAVKVFRIRLREDGITKIFLVGAYSRAQAAELLQCSESHLALNYDKRTPAELERAQSSPGQVWVMSPGAPNFVKWPRQAGVIWA